MDRRVSLTVRPVTVTPELGALSVAVLTLAPAIMEGRVEAEGEGRVRVSVEHVDGLGGQGLYLS